MSDATSVSHSLSSSNILATTTTSSSFCKELQKNTKAKMCAQHTFPTPKTIGKYKIDGVYGQGGMSILYLATDLQLQQKLIIKVLLPKLALDQVNVHEFLNEAKIISSCPHHPNIVDVYEYGQWENSFYIAMEYIEGQTLRKILRYSPFSLQRALDVLIQMSHAVWHLHTHGVIHGDLKPENILVTEQCQVKIIDFGISCRIHEILPQCDKNSLTEFKGTPEYMGPELHRNCKSYSYQSDIYSLGIIAYELVLGKITHGKVILSLAPKGMQKILYKSLKPHPQERYSSLHEMIHDLSKYAQSAEKVTHDTQGMDYFFELFEHLEKEQKNLLKSLQAGTAMSAFFGMTCFSHVRLNGLYYSSHTMCNGYFFFTCSTQSFGVQSIIEIYRIHSLWNMICSSDTTKETDQNTATFFSYFAHLLFVLNQQNISIKEYSVFSLDTVNKTYNWISTEWGKLFTKLQGSDASSYTLAAATPTSTVAAAILPEYFQRKIVYHSQNRYIEPIEFFLACCATTYFFETCSPSYIPIETKIATILNENIFLTPTKKTSHVLQTLQLCSEYIIDTHPAIFMSISSDFVFISKEK